MLEPLERSPRTLTVSTSEQTPLAQAKPIAVAGVASRAVEALRNLWGRGASQTTSRGPSSMLAVRTQAAVAQTGVEEPSSRVEDLAVHHSAISERLAACELAVSQRKALTAAAHEALTFLANIFDGYTQMPWPHNYEELVRVDVQYVDVSYDKGGGINPGWRVTTSH